MNGEAPALGPGVVHFEHKALYTMRGPVPDAAESAEPEPLGRALIRRKGRDVTIVSYSRTVHDALAAAEQLQADDGIGAEVIDLRSLWPWDKATVIRSLMKTRRVVIAHEAPRAGGFGGEVAATLIEEAFDYLDAPIVRLGAPHVPIPFSPSLEQQVRVTPSQIVHAVRTMG